MRSPLPGCPDVMSQHSHARPPTDPALRVKALESLLVDSGFRHAVRLEEGTKWILLARWMPAFVDWWRSWLIVKAEK